MGRLFRISILISLLAILNGHILVDQFEERRKSVESALKFMKIGLQEFSEGIERMVMKRLDGVESIVEEKIKQMIRNATMNIVEDQSTDQNEKVSGKVLSTLETDQTHKIESPTTKVDKKIDDLLFTTQIEQRLFRQEMISVTASLFGKLEKISDALSTTQTEQQLLNEEIKSLLANFFEKIDQNNSNLITATQNEQRLLRQKIEFLSINLPRIIEEKMRDVLLTNLTEQLILNPIFESLSTNFSENVDKKIRDRLSSIQSEQHIIKQVVLSFRTNLVGKVDDIRNTSLYVAEQLSSGEAIYMLRNVEKIGQFLIETHKITDCADILDKNPNTRGKNGVYNITTSSYIFKAVYCDMTTDNGGWTVIQRRVNGSEDFYRNWTDYMNGFGFADHEHWIGNDILHRLTSLKPQELRVDMERFNGEKAYAVYSSFSLGDEASKYKLQVNGYSGTAGDSLTFSNNSKFSTFDQDNDGDAGNCATYHRSAGWFSNCYHANPNGHYTESEKIGPHGYVSWYKWKNSLISLKAMQLMIRPRV